MTDAVLSDDWWHPKHYGPDWRKSPAVVATLAALEANGLAIVPLSDLERIAAGTGGIKLARAI